MTTELAPDAQFEELVERVLATTIFNEPFVAQLITEAHNARGRVAEAEAERDTARQIASNAIAEAKKLRAELTETEARARHGSAPLTLAQAAGHLHDWARDLADGTRTDWPAGHPDIIRGIRAAADWLDARDRYETETREQHLTALREVGRRLGESLQQLGEAIRDGAAKACAAREAKETPEPAEPTWRDVIRAMRAENIRLRPLYDIANWPADRTWQLIDRHGNELGIVTHETSYAGEDWALALSYERGPSTRIGAEALEPTDVLAVARLAGLIGDDS